MPEAPPTLHGPAERILAAVGRARRHSEQKRGHTNALRQLMEECRRLSPALAERMSKEIAGIQVESCCLLSEINGIATEFARRPADQAATTMALHPVNQERELPLLDHKQLAAGERPEDYALEGER